MAVVANRLGPTCRDRAGRRLPKADTECDEQCLPTDALRSTPENRIPRRAKRASRLVFRLYVSQAHSELANPLLR